MSRALLDENICQRIGSALRQAGWDVVFASLMSPGAPDEEILAESVWAKRILITRDRDYDELVLRQGRAAFGILYIRLRPDEQVEADVVRLAQEAEGRFITLDPAGLRRRPLPPSSSSEGF